MSFYIDVKYLEQIGHRLPLFVKKKPDLWNCRCIICGDSQKNKRKARGYFFRQHNDLYYKCHNCEASQHFGTFLKSFDAFLYKQYVFERFSKGENGPKAHKNLEDAIQFKFEEPRSVSPEERAFRDICTPVDELPENHLAVRYCNMRQIPVDKRNGLYYIQHASDITKIAPQYDEGITTDEPRLVFPFWVKGSLVGVTMRDMGVSDLRYIMAKFVENAPTIFNYDGVDTSKPFYVVEGPIDSLFLDNAMACNGTSFGKLDTFDIPKKNAVVVIDNQPRNREVCHVLKKYIDLGYAVCIWPDWLHEKDINDMVKAGHDVKRIIEEHTSQGLLAQLNFTQWRKI